MAGKNLHLNSARKAGRDEYYTQYDDIAREMAHYTNHFFGKTVLLNCDDPTTSNFWKYFADNFGRLGLSKLISTHYDESNSSYMLTMSPNSKARTAPEAKDAYDIVKTPLLGDGDFASDECLMLLTVSDIVVTNPPFSKLREFIALLVERNKKFLVLGNQNAITYKEFFPLIKDDKMWLGANSGSMTFEVPEDYNVGTIVKDEETGKRFAKFGNICWFTNLDYDRRHEKLSLTAEYNMSNYPRYDNYNAVNVGKVKDIPKDFYGIMGVPITFMYKYNPEQFEILWQASGNARKNMPDDIKELVGYEPNPADRGGTGLIDGQRIYSRILIRRRLDQAIRDRLEKETADEQVRQAATSRKAGKRRRPAKPSDVAAAGKPASKRSHVLSRSATKSAYKTAAKRARKRRSS